MWRDLRDAGPGGRLAVGCRLLLVNRVRLDTIAGNRMEENEAKLEPASVSASFVSTSNHNDLHSERSGCCLTSASKSHVSSSLGFNSRTEQGRNKLSQDGIWVMGLLKVDIFSLPLQIPELSNGDKRNGNVLFTRRQMTSWICKISLVRIEYCLFIRFTWA